MSNTVLRGRRRSTRSRDIFDHQSRDMVAIERVEARSITKKVTVWAESTKIYLVPNGSSVAL